MKWLPQSFWWFFVSAVIVGILPIALSGKFDEDIKEFKEKSIPNVLGLTVATFLVGMVILIALAVMFDAAVWIISILR